MPFYLGHGLSLDLYFKASVIIVWSQSSFIPIHNSFWSSKRSVTTIFKPHKQLSFIHVQNKFLHLQQLPPCKRSLFFSVFSYVLYSICCCMFLFQSMLPIAWHYLRSFWSTPVLFGHFWTMTASWLTKQSIKDKINPLTHSQSIICSLLHAGIEASLLHQTFQNNKCMLVWKYEWIFSQI